MKKILVIAAVAVAASMAQAVAVGWSVTKLNFDTSTTLAADAQAYFFIVGSTEMGTKTFADIEKIAKEGGDISAYASSQSSVSSGGGAGVTAAKSGIDVAESTTYQVFTIAYDSASSPSGYITSGQKDMVVQKSAKTQTFGSAANFSGGWTAVPEPTTVALLALGLAALGLKRKVA